MKDFTLKAYRFLIESLQNAGYSFITLELFDQSKEGKEVIIRHDIDTSKYRALKFAELEHSLGIKASYFFRIKKCSFNEELIKKIASMGHEIGYHYEDLTMNHGNFEKAIVSFEKNLNIFRKLYPVKTICMHGRAISKFDNRSLWKKFDYHDFGIIYEPYFDINYDKVLYLTDTGQSWSGSKYSLRDKVKSSLDYTFTSTFDLVNQVNQLPDKILITSHPDRWSFTNLEWIIINSHLWLRDRLKRILFFRRFNNVIENINN